MQVQNSINNKLYHSNLVKKYTNKYYRNHCEFSNLLYNYSKADCYLILQTIQALYMEQIFIRGGIKYSSICIPVQTTEH